ncbi:MAG TPA: hypothetical protein DEP48_06010 [Persephonella sp.]|uniref:Uncharacterized protein n=1 Tax=Persephonella marina (strain DSM 14350 / EX-H1) TaxID=123214 RepID=C0QP92_PERMH|nr:MULTISPECIES: hypothetical protein [Persephonella]ACO04862.1 hypothetical protein PERMA_0700 [Persephonella marina EX-H1]HCB69897.1 hypothetical protein [Persephonella sp.]
MYRFFVLLFLFITFFSYGDVLEYRKDGRTFLKLYVVKEYPEKQKFYVKEPVHVRFIIGLLKTDIRSVEENIDFILQNIKIQTLISERTVISDIQKKVSGKRVIVDYVVYFMRDYDTDLPFLISIDTDRLKGMIDDPVLERLKESFIVKSEDYYRIVPVPKDIIYVGSFDIKTKFEDRKGFGTFYIIIEGRGFPYLPKYSLVVKNGSAKKTGYTFDHKLENVRSVQKYKVVYMDELEIKPVKFRYFDPFQEKIVEKKTEEFLLKPEKKEVKSYWEMLSEEEKMRYYLSRFKELYPEQFYEESLISKLFISLYKYRYEILAFFVVFPVFLLFFVVRFGRYIYPSDIREMICLKGNRIEDYKKVYRYISKDVYSLKDLIRELDAVLYRSRWVVEGKKLKKAVYEDIEIYPDQIKDIFRKIMLIILEERSKGFSKGKRYLMKAVFLVRDYVYLILLFASLILIFGGSFVLSDIFFSYRMFIMIFASVLSFFVVVFFYFLSKPRIKVG